MEDTVRLYLYVNSNRFLYYLMKNAIVCSDYLNDAKAVCSIGDVCGQYLYLTHKKLCVEDRSRTAAGGLEMPVTLEIVIKIKSDIPMPAQIVDNAGTVKSADLKAYNLTKDTGAFIAGEIPWSFVSRVYFNSDRDREEIYKPSPDLWYPEQLFSIIPSDKFTDEFHFDKFSDACNAVPEAGDGLIKLLSAREKQRAVLINTLFSTQNWDYQKYRANVTPGVLRMFDLSAKPVEEQIGQKYSDIEDLAEMDDLLDSDEDNTNRMLFKSICESFAGLSGGAELDHNKFCHMAGDVIFSICGRPEEKRNEGKRAQSDSIIKALAIAEKVAFQPDDHPFDQALKSVDRTFSSIKALMFVLKNPDDIDYFARSLDSYGADCVVKRTAWIYYSWLNGMKNMPGERRNNLQLNLQIDRMVFESCSDKSLISGVYSEDEYCSIIGTKPAVNHGYKVIAENNISPEIAAEFLIRMSRDGRTVDLGDVLNMPSVRKLVKADDYKIYTVPEDIKKGDKLTKQQLQKLLKTLRATEKNPEINIRKFVKDNVENKAKFKKIYDAAPKEWAELVKKGSNEQI